MRRKKKNDHPLFDTIWAREAKKAAVRQSNENADRNWNDEAADTLYEVALAQETLTADDLRERMVAKARTTDDFPQTHDLRATGPIMIKGKAEGWIKPTDYLRAGRVVSSHGRPQRVWESLIYRNGSH